IVFWLNYGKTASQRGGVRTNEQATRRLGLLCAITGCVNRAFGRKEPIEYKVHGAKSREATLDQRDADHSGHQQPMHLHIVSQCDPNRDHDSDDRIMKTTLVVHEESSDDRARCRETDARAVLPAN